MFRGVAEAGYGAPLGVQEGGAMAKGRAGKIELLELMQERDNVRKKRDDLQKQLDKLNREIERREKELRGEDK